MEQPKPCYIEWYDINTDGGPWVNFPVVMRPSLCRSVAWLLFEDEDSITISSTWSEADVEDECHGALQAVSIPRGCIRKLQPITLGID